MDSSGSIEKSGKGNYKKCLDFIKTAVNGSFISETFTHVGLVLFSSKVCAIMHERSSSYTSSVTHFTCYETLILTQGDCNMLKT